MKKIGFAAFASLITGVAIAYPTKPELVEARPLVYVFQNPSIALKVITATSKGNLNAWTDGEGRTIKAMWEKATKRNQKDATKD